MPFSEAFKLAIQSLWANKLRTILTLVGVVMGVASVIMVVTLVLGAKKYVTSKFSHFGADVFTVSRMPGVIFTAEEYLRYQKRKILRTDDYEAITENCTLCSEVGARLDTNGIVIANSHSSNNTHIQGYTWTMFNLSNLDIDQGRGFTPSDQEHALHVAVVGYDIIDNLLGDGDPIGKEIRVGGTPYTIIGVGERQGKTLGQSQDNWVTIPITTYQQTYGYNTSVSIYARAIGGAAAMDDAQDQVRSMMRTRRHNAPGEPDDFIVETSSTFLDIVNQLLAIFAWVVLGIACISLVVGGIVIMNIMLVSVTERTREIGVRKALGAKRRDILLQFLIESALMALLGGAIGVVGGVGAGFLVSVLGGPEISAPIWSVLLGLFMATSVGVFFGVYPASKAAKLDPIVALRSEM